MNKIKIMINNNADIGRCKRWRIDAFFGHRRTFLAVLAAFGHFWSSLDTVGSSLPLLLPLGPHLGHFWAFFFQGGVIPPSPWGQIPGCSILTGRFRGGGILQATRTLPGQKPCAILSGKKTWKTTPHWTAK